MIQINMGQIISNLWSWLCPNIKIQTHKRHDHIINYQTFYYDDDDDVEVNHFDESHFVNISDHHQPVPEPNTRVYGIHHHHDSSCGVDDSSADFRIVVDLISRDDEDDANKIKEKKHENSITKFGDHEQVWEKNVTTSVNYVPKRVSKKVFVKKLGPYTSAQRILLVGEGDFSFSASLAVAFGSDLQIVATSLDSEDFLIKNYPKSFLSNMSELVTRGGMVLHEVDAKNMAKHCVLSNMVFDRIIYNFPHCGKFKINDYELWLHQKLISGFLRNAKELLQENGEIHVTSKSNGFYLKWDIPKLGRDQGLNLIREVRFRRSKYPGYNTKYGFGGDKDFHCDPSKTYKFGLPKIIK